jgi:hypothetical protein
VIVAPVSIANRINAFLFKLGELKQAGVKYNPPYPLLAIISNSL